jgi:hypothetical protein
MDKYADSEVVGVIRFLELVVEFKHGRRPGGSVNGACVALKKSMLVF